MEEKISITFKELLEFVKEMYLNGIQDEYAELKDTSIGGPGEPTNVEKEVKEFFENHNK